MELSFNCFKNYSDNLFCLFDRLEKTYFAHLSHDEKEKESLYGHSKLVSDYFFKLIEAHGIENYFDVSTDQLITALPIVAKIEWGNLFKEAFYGAIVFHDLGKVNPNFQVQKMKNDLFVLNNKLSIKTSHSLLGAYIYAIIFFEKTANCISLNDEEKELLYFIILLFASAVIKHHNPNIDLVLVYDKTELNDSYSFLKDVFHIFLEEKFCQSFFVRVNQIFDDIKNIINDKNVYCQLFVNVKVLYSLLTISDFYATNEFMSKIKIDDFGCLKVSDKNRLVSNFQTIKPYNQDLYVNFNYYLFFPFDKLENRSNVNLNTLRQKLTAEMISNLKAHSDKHCFYVEAPTGAGKTNLSLAFSIELLNIDVSLRKIFYVFPFTTLITQTFKSVKDTLGIMDDDTIIQIHSKAGFPEREDGVYGNEKKLFIDSLFVNYPITLMSHIRFFDILKGNEKESNYLLHRLYNSIVIIDEIQTYNPEHWDKIVYFLANYARIFNIRVLVMSATLPQIDALHDDIKGTFISLIPNRDKYFTNNNFSGRVSFDFSLLNKERPVKENKEQYLSALADFIVDKSNQYALENHDSVKVLVEFITKRTASVFFKFILKTQIKDYKILLLSGDILEFRRKEIISQIKESQFSKVIVVATQVVEAGVDIDMDLGFKDHSLLDSDEQLAGRINRNASKSNCAVYLFDCDKTSTIYGDDARYKVQQLDKDIYDDYKRILQEKQFHSLYEKVFEKKRQNMKSNFFTEGHYYQYFRDFNFFNLHYQFQLIEDNDSQQLFIPVFLPVKYFDDSVYLEKIKVLSDDKQNVDGEKVFNCYKDIVHGEFKDFSLRQIEYKKLGSVISQFCISIYNKQLVAISDMLDFEKSKYGYQYLSNWKLCYSLEYGFDSDKIDTSVFL
jgi:CRISPR-associated endonuclease/helicase Cas3